jgi:hypothetical protein
LPNVFPEQWLGQGGPPFWSVRFSDFNPLDNFERCHPRCVYKTNR